MTSSLGPVRRIVTTHNNDAHATILANDSIPPKILPHGPASCVLWATHSNPAQVTDNDAAQGEIDFVTNGSVLRIVDLPPGSTGSLHRTISLDYIIVLSGSVTLSLDDGTTTEVNAGDIVVQQATMHGWNNHTKFWSRLCCVMLKAEPPVIGGEALETVVDFL